MSLLIMKFGGASVKSTGQFERIAKIIQQRRAQFDRIVVTVSAMGTMTDELLAMAQQVNTNPSGRELDMLLSVGERVSVALLTMALEKIDVRAVSLTGSQSGIITSHEHTDAKVIDVRTVRLLKHLNDNRIPVVAGFQGMSIAGEITTLGRGGTDLTAVALGCALGAAHVEFYKDVPGVYDLDPKKHTNAVLLSKLGYEQAIKIMECGAKILQARCVRLAQRNALPLRVLPFNVDDGLGTFINDTNIARPLSPVFEIADGS